MPVPRHSGLTGRLAARWRSGLSRRQRGFAILVVLGALIILGMALASLQHAALSQAVEGREALARTRAYWAARAGIETAIARLAFDTQNPDDSDAFRTLLDLDEASEGFLQNASYAVVRSNESGTFIGAVDLHARININLASADQLLLVEPLMLEDVIDSVLDWIDEDDDPNELGAEIGYYAGLPLPYEPRNAPMRSILELELVAGVDAIDVRGEDWNQNGVLDPNEDDGDASWPPDNADGILDSGWSGILTAQSVDGALYGASGELRLDLTTAAEADIVARTQVSQQQAAAIVAYVQGTSGAVMEDFIRRNLGQLSQTVGGGNVQQLSTEQLRALYEECVIPAPPGPGRLNINTCSDVVLEYLPELSDELREAVIAERNARSGGFGSMIDLLEVEGMNRATLAALAAVATTRSNVYRVTVRGRDANSGLEVEMVATLDRSVLPVVVKEVRVR